MIPEILTKRCRRGTSQKVQQVQGKDTHSSTTHGELQFMNIFSIGLDTISSASCCGTWTARVSLCLFSSDLSRACMLYVRYVSWP
ncbi:hypothetical protein MPTK1_2g01850 [Marchantia polymorpha subsp. ruderalis]|uniref:Uncharacterized protein n=1 Tax=Marchantia polymorpha TaxID=3197 RepID=A0A2R6W202_MARPO|nr:hypothetical protein MARPO_0180s0009 [Marchantia polymorpha]BBN00757.1 hypothetical protein Mp_2g01850 [Marchantia polymorpha subsp. ruderalis]|eukprot:PTQ27885.1 hypothetical protein MARPO_0180s0009 [Marchantia polymorpha]